MEVVYIFSNNKGRSGPPKRRRAGGRSSGPGFEEGLIEETDFSISRWVKVIDEREAEVQGWIVGGGIPEQLIREEEKCSLKASEIGAGVLAVDEPQMRNLGEV